MYGFFLIVFMGGQFFVGYVVFVFYFWWIEFDVVYVIGCCVDVMVNDVVDDQFVWYVEFQYVINGNVCFFYGVSLWNGLWEVVQQEVVMVIFLGDMFFYQCDDQFIGYQFVSVYNVFCLFIEFRVGFYCCVQYIVGGDLWNIVFFYDELSLSFFICVWSVKQNNMYYENFFKS